MNIVASDCEIHERVKLLASQINRDYEGLTLDIVCLIQSASMFCADLVRHLNVATRLHYMSFTTYPQGNATGEIRIIQDVAEPLYDRHVLLMEGIVVSGRTPRYVLDMLQLRQPRSLAMCALGLKPALVAVPLPLKYVAFELGEEIAAGYGIGTSDEKGLKHLVEQHSL